VVKIEATFEPPALQAVLDALQELGLSGFTVMEARTEGEPQDSRRYRGSLHRPGRACARIEIVLPGRRLEEALEQIARVAVAEGSDGRVVVSPVSGVVRIRTGETEEDAVAG
jgi:nitrogen regulatory protein P-II 1